MRLSNASSFDGSAREESGKVCKTSEKDRIASCLFCVGNTGKTLIKSNNGLISVSLAVDKGAHNYAP